MKWELNTATLLLLLLVQGCGEHVPPEVNDENCSKVKDPFASHGLKFKSGEEELQFGKDCLSFEREKNKNKNWFLDNMMSKPDNPNPEIFTQPEINKENCSKIYREDGSISKEYREKFHSNGIWETFAEVCRANQL